LNTAINVFGQELISENGISVIAAAFFTALFAAVSAIGVQIVKNRGEVRDLRDVTVEAAEHAENAEKNTVNVSNGFARKVDTKLDQIIRKQDELEGSIREHLEWHLNNKTP
jgi:hypothetical protein